MTCHFYDIIIIESVSGTFYQYDGLIFPEAKSETLIKTFSSAVKKVAKGAKDALVQWLTSTKSDEPSATDDEFKPHIFSSPISHEKGQEQAFLLFITTHDTKLNSLDFSKTNYIKFVNNVNHVFEQCYRQKLCFHDRKIDEERIAIYLPKVYS